MRTIHILVEGSKDAYFVHELILQRFGALFDRVQNPIRLKSTCGNEPVVPVEMCSIDRSIAVRIFAMGGYKKVVNFVDKLTRPATMRIPTDKFVSTIVFDADIAPASGGRNVDNAGQVARRKELLDMLKIMPSKTRTATKSIFLFPDNRRDGDLETLMREVVDPTPSHVAFFEICWKCFCQCLGRKGCNEPTRKSMMNEYNAAFDLKAWHPGGQDKCIENKALWDWNATSLKPLCTFLDKCFKGSAIKGLATCVDASKF